MANHLRSDFDLVELLAGVDTDDAADHLGDDDHVSQMRLDEVRLLVGLSLLLSLAQLLDQAHGLSLETSVDPAAGSGVDDIAKLLGAEIEETIIVQNHVSLKIFNPDPSRLKTNLGGICDRTVASTWDSTVGIITYASRSIPR